MNWLAAEALISTVGYFVIDRFSLTILASLWIVSLIIQRTNNPKKLLPLCSLGFVNTQLLFGVEYNPLWILSIALFLDPKLIDLRKQITLYTFLPIGLMCFDTKFVVLNTTSLLPIMASVFALGIFTTVNRLSFKMEAPVWIQKYGLTIYTGHLIMIMAVLHVRNSVENL